MGIFVYEPNEFLILFSIVVWTKFVTENEKNHGYEKWISGRSLYLDINLQEDFYLKLQSVNFDDKDFISLLEKEFLLFKSKNPFFLIDQTINIKRNKDNKGATLLPLSDEGEIVLNDDEKDNALSLSKRELGARPRPQYSLLFSSDFTLAYSFFCSDFTQKGFNLPILDKNNIGGDPPPKGERGIAHFLRK